MDFRDKVLAGFFYVAAIVIVGLAACGDNVAPPRSPSVSGPTTELERMGAVKMQAPDPALVAAHEQSSRIVQGLPPVAPTKVASKKQKTREIKKLADVAAVNAARSLCLRLNVDHKIDFDVKTNKIRDLGNVRDWDGCKGDRLAPFMAEQDYHGGVRLSAKSGRGKHKIISEMESEVV